MENRVKFLSPTSFMLFSEDPDEYYCRYVSKHRLPKEPQTAPMAIGSAFDARIKAYLFNEIHGTCEDFGLNKLFEEQVEPQHYDVAYRDSLAIFEQYMRNGSLVSLLNEMGSARNVSFESTVETIVGGVPLLGKPDLSFSIDGVYIVFDWKVNGYYSRSGHSPKAGYTAIWPGGESHKTFIEGKFKGIRMNKAVLLEDIDKVWATQLSIYSWLLGVGITDPFLAALDQLVFKPWSSGQRGQYSLVNDKAMRVAQHRYVIGRDFRTNLFKEIIEAWKVINSDHFFRYMTKEESQQHEKELEEIGLSGSFEREL